MRYAHSVRRTGRPARGAVLRTDGEPDSEAAAADQAPRTSPSEMRTPRAQSAARIGFLP